MSDDFSPWTPKVLSDFEWGKCIGAIESVRLLGKPIAEVATVPAHLSDLEADLQNCLRGFRVTGGVKFWTRESNQPGHYRYGFYREPWALDAIDFIARTNLSVTDRAWISGLVYGYSPKSIQDYIERRQQQETMVPA